MEKLLYSFTDLQKDLNSIIQQMVVDGFTPDVIVGPGRGGYIPGVMLSHYFEVPFEGIRWQLRDGNITDDKTLRHIVKKHFSDNILVIDDINDSGATLKGIFEIIAEESQLSDVRCATLITKTSSNFGSVDYTGRTLQPDYNPWIVFPYEEWWK
jgi:hypoxanthine phosphoribosyltransferase